MASCTEQLPQIDKGGSKLYLQNPVIYMQS